MFEFQYPSCSGFTLGFLTLSDFTGMTQEHRRTESRDCLGWKGPLEVLPTFLLKPAVLVWSFLLSTWYSAVFCIQYEGKVYNTLMLQLWLNHVYNKSRAYTLSVRRYTKKKSAGFDGLLRSG